MHLLPDFGKTEHGVVSRPLARYVARKHGLDLRPQEPVARYRHADARAERVLYWKECDQSTWADRIDLGRKEVDIPRLVVVASETNQLER